MIRLNERSEMMREAARQSRGLHLVLEILIFIVVFFCANMISGILSLIPTIVLMLSSGILPHLREAVTSGDLQGLADAIMQVSMSSWMVVISLFATVGTILAVFIYCRFIEKRRLSTLGFVKKGAVSEYVTGLLVGFFMFSVAVVLNVAFGAITYEGVFVQSAPLMIVLMFFGFMIQGASEEILCRGYFCVSAARKSSVVAAVIANSAIFALLHILNNGFSWLPILNLVLFGIFASYYMIRRGNLWGICAIHSIWNFAQGNFYGLAVSGIDTGNTVLRFSAVEGRELIHGGAFGPEGGLAVTIVLVISCVVVLLMKNKDKGWMPKKNEEESVSSCEKS